MPKPETLEEELKSRADPEAFLGAGPYNYSSAAAFVGTGFLQGRYSTVETRPAPASKPRGWTALKARIGEEALMALEIDVVGEAAFCEVSSRRWQGVLFRVFRSGLVAVVVPGGGEVARASAPVYPRGNGEPPPWPEVVLARLLLLESDETLLFGDGAFGGVEPITRSVRLRE